MWFMTGLIIIFLSLWGAYIAINYNASKRAKEADKIVKETERLRIKKEEYDKQEIARQERQKELEKVRQEARKILAESKESSRIMSSDTHITEARGGIGNSRIIGWETIRTGDTVIKRAITKNNQNVPLSAKRTNVVEPSPTYIDTNYFDNNHHNYCNDDTGGYSDNGSNDGGGSGCD